MKTISVKYLGIFCLVILVGQIFGQEIQWANHAGGSGTENGGSSVIDKSGNSYFCGIFKGHECIFKTDTLHQWGYNGMFIVKYDADGDEIWVKRYGNYNKDIPVGFSDMVYDSSSNKIYCTGGIFIDGQGNLNFIAEYDTAGRNIWMRTYPGVSLSSGFNALTLDENENIYVTGSISTTVKFDTIPVSAGGFIAKFDSNGQCIWAKRKFGYNSTSISEVTTIGIKVRNEKIFVSGHLEYNGTVFIDTMQISHKGYGSSLVMCFDNNCNIQWVSEGISKTTFSYSDLAIDKSSNIYFTGGFGDTISFSGNLLVTLPFMTDMFLVKYNKYGEVQWSKQTHAEHSEGLDLISDENGNTYVTGYFYGEASFGSYKLKSLSTKDMFLARYDSTGDCKGVINFPNGNGNGLSQDVNGNPLLIFIFYTMTTMGQNTFNSYGSSDVIFIKASAITGIGETKKSKQNQLLIFANPNTGKCKITIPEEFIQEKNLTLHVFDSEGKLIQQAPIEKVDGKIKLNIEAQAKGIYNAILSNGKKSYTGKIVYR